MHWKIFYLTLLLSSVVYVQSKSYIEVDESGNEYEVKRFHIQGRQLSDKNQQCVITRRKRSPSTKNARQYGNADPIFTVDEDVDNTNNSDVKDKIEDDENKQQDFVILKEGQNDTVSLPPPNMFNYQIKDEFDEDDNVELTEENEKPISVNEKETEAAEDKVPVPVKGKPKKEKKEKYQKVTLIRPHASANKEEEEMEQEAEKEEHGVLQIVPSSFLSNTGANNFVIVQTQPQPQKVSALNSVLNVLPTEEDYGSQAELLPFSWSYENQPISTTAVWSTGEDVSDNIFDRMKNSDQLDYPPLSGLENEDELEEFETLHPVRINRNKNKKKNKKQNKNRINRYPANKPNRRIPNRKNQRPAPVKQIIRRKYHNGASSPNKANKSKRRSQQSNKKKQNKNRTTPLAITSETMITTIDDDPQIECIIINKETSTTSTTSTTTSTTTRRPFWNILGRRATNVEEPRNYGLRKRAALRFVA